MSYPAGNYLIKVNTRNVRIMCEISSKLIVKHQNDAIDVDLVALLLNLNRLYTLFWCSHL